MAGESVREYPHFFVSSEKHLSYIGELVSIGQRERMVSHLFCLWPHRSL